MLLCNGGLTLSDCLKHQNGGRNGDIEGVTNAQHGNLDMGISCLAPLVGQSSSLSTHHDGGGRTHACIIVVSGVLQLGSENLDAKRLQPLDTRFRGAGDSRHASTWAASAERRMAPTLPGFSTRSMTTIRGDSLR